MTLHELIEQYISQHSSLIPVSVAALRAFEKHVALHNDVSFINYDLSQWQRFFSQARPGLMTLRRYRTSLIAFYDWLITSQGITDAEGACQILRNYHVGDVLAQTALGNEGYDGSYTALMDRLEAIKMREGDTRTNYGALCAIFTLVWFGLTPQVALDIRKEDLVFSTEGVAISIAQSPEEPPRLLRIRNPRAVGYLNDYLHQTDVSRLDGKQLRLVPSPWLFRSTQTEHITLNAIQRYIAGLNQELGVRSAFSLVRTHDSAVYAKAFAYITRLGYIVSPTPHADLARHVPRLLELADSADAYAAYYAWRAFYSWCRRFRPAETP